MKVVEASTPQKKETSSRSKEAVTTESQPVSASQTEVSKSKKVQSKEYSTAQGLAALKSLIAKAAAGTLNSKSSATKTSTGTKTYDSVDKATQPKSSAKIYESVDKATPATASEGKLTAESKMKVEKKTTTSTSTSTSTGSNETRLESAAVQENDYWMEEKLKMQNAPTYQSFQKGVQMKKNLTSKGTSPPPQTISTQVFKTSLANKCMTLNSFSPTDIRGRKSCSRSHAGKDSCSTGSAVSFQAEAYAISQHRGT